MGKKSCRRKSPCGILMFIKCKNTAENTANLFSEFIFDFKNTFKENRLFF